MSRILLAFVLVVVATACGVDAGSGQPSPSASAAGEANRSPSPSADPTDAASATPMPSTPAGPSLPAGHPATGLTIVQWPDPNSPRSEVFVVEADGSLRRLTGASNSMPGAATPAWSPDGAWLAFSSAKVGAPVIPPVGIVRADGSDEHVIGLGVNPAWSPDSTRIVFQEVVDIERPLRTFLFDMRSGELIDIGLGESPQWTPDGRVALVEGLSDPNAGFRLMTRLPQPGDAGVEVAANAFGRWSPDGTALLLDTPDGVLLAGPDGANPRGVVRGWGPAWSPDSRLVVVNVDHDNDAVPVLAVVDLDGRIVWSGARGEAAVWSPDGTRLAVEISYPEPSVHVLDAATGQVLAEYVGAKDPTWRP